MPQNGITARGKRSLSNTARAHGSERRQAAATASEVTRFAPADSPASTTRAGSTSQAAAFFASQA
jgi:hypothetical protein